MTTHALLFFPLITLTSCTALCGLELDPPWEFADEGRIVIYSPQESDQLRRNITAFRKAYPKIRVECLDGSENENCQRISSGALLTKLRNEKQLGDPIADVVYGLALTKAQLLQTDGYFEPFAPRGLERLSRPEYRDPQEPPSWVGITIWMNGLCVNRVKLTSHGIQVLPKTWQDLTNPIYQGLVAIPYPKATGTGFAFLSMLMQVHADNPKAAWDYLDQLDRNIPKGGYSAAGRDPCDWVRDPSRPNVAIGVSFDGSVLGKDKDPRRDEVETAFPAPAGWEIEVNALLHKTQVSAAARTFLSWAISDEAMSAYSNDFYETSVSVQRAVAAEGFPPNPEALMLRPNCFTCAAANYDAWIDQFTARYGAKFGN